jgi:two-component system response regulator WspF
MIASCKEPPRLATPGDAEKAQTGRFLRTQPSPAPPETLIVMGASAGGPTALAQVLGGLPSDFAAAVVVIQHIDPQFAHSLADWLNSRSRLSVRLAEAPEYPERGVALVAGRNAHLVFTSPRCIGYVNEPNDSAYRPSIDLLFQSAERFWNGPIIGVLLTGIGRDGAQGLRRLRSAGGHTIAQDAASSAVYGMPKAAAELCAATDILPLNNIAPRLIELVANRAHLHV